MSNPMRNTARALGLAMMLGITAVQGTSLAAPTGPTPIPSGGGESEARARYSRGVELYNEGVYSAALVELERAQAIAPHFGILHSIGLVKMQLADFVGALTAFEEYLVAGGDEIPVARRTEIREKVAQLQERIGTVELIANVEGAELLLDDNIVGLSPLAKPVRANPGKHEVAARRPGEKGITKKVSIAGGDKLKVTFDLETGKATDTRAPVAASSNRPKWLVSTWAAAGVFAVGATVTGIIALNKSSELKDLRDSPTPGKDLNELGNEVKTFGVVTDVLIVPAILLTAISAYFTFKPNKAKTTDAATGFKPQFGLGRMGLGATF